jgi:hypothetical protein
MNPSVRKVSKLKSLLRVLVWSPIQSSLIGWRYFTHGYKTLTQRQEAKKLWLWTPELLNIISKEICFAARGAVPNTLGTDGVQ